MTNHVTFETLNDFADELLASADHATVARHLAECAECAAELARLRKALAVAASVPRRIEPPADLWPALRARLETAAVGAPADAGSGPGSGGEPPRVLPFPGAASRFTRRDRVWLAAAGLLLVAGSSAITATMMRSRSSTVADASGAERPPSLALPAAFLQTDAGYRIAVAEMAEALDSARTRLSPKTVATLEHTLGVIDTAIAEARQALARDPANQTLIDVLSSNYERKLELLRRVSEIPAKS